MPTAIHGANWFIHAVLVTLNALDWFAVIDVNSQSYFACFPGFYCSKWFTADFLSCVAYYITLEFSVSSIHPSRHIYNIHGGTSMICVNFTLFTAYAFQWRNAIYLNNTLQFLNRKWDQIVNFHSWTSGYFACNYFSPCCDNISEYSPQIVVEPNFNTAHLR